MSIGKIINALLYYYEVNISYATLLHMKSTSHRRSLKTIFNKNQSPNIKYRNGMMAQVFL